MILRCVTLVLVVLLAASATPPTPTPSASDVQTITIDTSIGVLGTPPKPYHGVITRQGDRFVRNDGTAIPNSAISTLLALTRPPYRMNVLARDAGLTADVLKQNLPAAESYLGSAVNTPSVRAVFDNTFLDPAKLQAWIDMRYSQHVVVTDFYPKINLAIETDLGAIHLASTSQAPMMLPFAINSDYSYDARLPQAIAALMPEKATNRKLLLPGNILSWWLLDLGTNKALRAAEDQVGRPEADAAAKVAGLTWVWYRTQGDARYWEGHVAPIAQPRIHVQVPFKFAPDQDKGAVLAEAARRAALLESVPWIAKALADQADGTIEITPSAYISWWVPKEFTDAGHAETGAYAKAHADEFLGVWMHSAQQGMWSEWLLLPDRRMVLESYSPGMRGFPFGDKEYAMFPSTTDETSTDRPFVGIVFDPDGSIDPKDL